MVIVDYTNIIVLIVMILFFTLMNTIGFIKKNAWFSLVSVIVSLAMFIIHVLLADFFGRNVLKFNALIDFICLAVNIPLLVIIDEIETRRDVIKSVFESRYTEKK